MTRLALAAAIALALAGCGSDPAPPAAAPTTTPPAATTTPSPTPATVATTSAVTPTATNAATDLADGTHYAYLKTFDRTKRTFSVDVVQFLTGKAAEDAAKEDGQEAFDYYVRNQNTRLRTLAYAIEMKVVVNTLTADQTGSATEDTEITHTELAEFFTKGDAQQRLFYFRLTNGRIVTMNEQYLP